MPAPSTSASPVVSRVENRPVSGRRRAVSSPAGLPLSIDWVMTDRSGNALDLTTVANGTVKYKAIDAVPIGGEAWTEFAGTIATAAAGVVTLPIDPTLLTCPAVLTVDVAVVSDAAAMVAANRFILYVDRSGWAATADDMGPPSVDEIRLHMRDSGPEDNMWLDAEEFDLAEVANAVEKCVRHWNEALPPIDQKYRTATWPWRMNMLDGVTSYLYRMAARHYRRVHLPYQAGGLAVDDKNKSAEYEQIAAALWQQYASWVQDQKVVLNVQGAYGVLGSVYGARAWHGWSGG